MKKENSPKWRAKWPLLLALCLLLVPVCAISLWAVAATEIFERQGEMIFANPGPFLTAWFLVLVVGIVLCLVPKKGVRRTGIVLVVLTVVPACGLSLCVALLLIVISPGGGWR